MCGFTGFIGRSIDGKSHFEVARLMANTINHRGPDSSGIWIDTDAGFAFAHQRLSILDISSAGHQPMQSLNERWMIVFNGEIYNHLLLRSELESVVEALKWRGQSDTETLLAGIEYWGIELTLQKCVGMFAMAIWDKEAQTLTLVRDRFGEKPLYFGWVGQGEHSAFVFGSELKAIRAFPGFNLEVCREALAQYLRFGYIPTPRSIYKGVYKLDPGCILEVSSSRTFESPKQPIMAGENWENVNLKRWWSTHKLVESSSQKLVLSDSEAIKLLESQLIETIDLQSFADVPIGAFLSGGVDSSTIVALMQCQSSRPIKTFTISFTEREYDEASYALAVARHLKTEHYEMRIMPNMITDVLNSLPEIYDEPFADSSGLPTYFVSKFAREHVKVALSGDAGDELFGGYNRYFWIQKFWSKLSWLPKPARNALGEVISSVPINGWDKMGAVLGSTLVNRGFSHFGQKAHRLGWRLKNVTNLEELYLSLISEWDDPASLIRTEDGQLPLELDGKKNVHLPRYGTENAQLKMMFFDMLGYLPDDILCKVDRAAMANSLETRVPFLDHRLVELAWQLPLDMKIRGGVSKWALREVLYRHVPKYLIERPKAGFAIPIGKWLQGPLRDWAESLLDENRLLSEGYFHPKLIRLLWEEHLKGKSDNTTKLWSILVFQLWLDRNKH